MSAGLLKKVRLLKLKLRRPTKDLLAGGYQSAFKGQGMIFADNRPYIHGDDIRCMSWGLTAKMGEPYIKLLEEEKGAVFIIVMDVSGSFDFGTQGFKAETACEAASLIAFSAQKNQDRTGLLLFSDRVEHYIPPAGGVKSVSCIVRDLYSFKRQSVQTRLSPALDFLHNVLKKPCYIFLFSDFLTQEDFTPSLRKIRRRHDVSALLVRDPFEESFPPLGLMELEDAESGQRQVVDTSSLAFKREYQARALKMNKQIEQKLTASQTDYFYIHTHQDLFKQLLSFIQKRKAG